MVRIHSRLQLKAQKAQRLDMIVMHLVGRPIPWKRPAHKVCDGKVWVFDSQKKDKEQIRWQMRSYVPTGQLLTCPCELEFIFAFNPPTTVSRAVRRQMLSGEIKCTRKPDIDNLQKLILDAMNGFIFVDDEQVHKITAEKIWSECEGTKIIIKPKHLHKDMPPSTILNDLDLPQNFLDDEPNEPINKTTNKTNKTTNKTIEVNFNENS